MNQGSVAMSESAKVDPVWENKQYLLSVIMNQCGITEEDMQTPSVVRSKVRESKIEQVLEKN